MKKHLYTPTIPAVLFLLLIVTIGALLRFRGLDWDQNHHLHPDERYISMVLSSITPPPSLKNYLDPDQSTLSPYIHGFGSYIYGQLPLTVLAYLSRWLGMEGYDKTYLLGRGISAMLDTLSIVLIYKLGRRLWNERIGTIGAAFYAFSPLPIQYSHFMTMESWLTFSWLAVLLAVIRLSRPAPAGLAMTVLAGILLGASLAIKFNSIFLFPLIAILILLSESKKSFSHYFLLIIFYSLFSIFSFRFFQPTIFSSASWLNWSLRSDFSQALRFQQQAIEGKVMFPPSWQWVDTAKWWFPLKNMMLFGLGPVAGILMVIGVIGEFWGFKGRRAPLNGVRSLSRLALAVFVVGVFFWQGGKFVKVMRYFLPFFPLYALFAASAIGCIGEKKRTVFAKTVLLGSVIVSGIWALMFTNIYRTTTTRIVASKWIYQNIPTGSKIMLEEWDDPLPLLLPNYALHQYKTEMVGVYAPDDEFKKKQINRWLNDFDWIVLSSPRAKGSIGRLPKQFPFMSRFYQDLENGSLGFMKTAEFTSFPSLEIGNWKLEINDSSSEESFWVYDHPKVEIYKKLKI